MLFVRYLRIFAQMKKNYEGRVHRYATENKVTWKEAARFMALQRSTGDTRSKKSNSPYEIIEVQKRQDYSLLMVNYNTTHSEAAYDPQTMAANEKAWKEGKKDLKPLPRAWDLSAYVVFDHRMGVSIEEVGRKAIECVLDDTVFMKMC